MILTIRIRCQPPANCSIIISKLKIVPAGLLVLLSIQSLVTVPVLNAARSNLHSKWIVICIINNVSSVVRRLIPVDHHAGIANMVCDRVLIIATEPVKRP
ncbi:hypothetical protein D3C80_1241730 [compost metagenome]